MAEATPVRRSYRDAEVAMDLRLHVREVAEWAVLGVHDLTGCIDEQRHRRRIAPERTNEGAVIVNNGWLLHADVRGEVERTCMIVSGIHAEHAHAAVRTGVCRLQRRHLALAWPTPRSPHVDQNRGAMEFAHVHARSRTETVEGQVGQFRRGLRGPALRARVQRCDGAQPVELAGMVAAATRERDREYADNEPHDHVAAGPFTSL